MEYNYEIRNRSTGEIADRNNNRESAIQFSDRYMYERRSSYDVFLVWNWNNHKIHESTYIPSMIHYELIRLDTWEIMDTIDSFDMHWSAYEIITIKRKAVDYPSWMFVQYDPPYESKWWIDAKRKDMFKRMENKENPSEIFRMKFDLPLDPITFNIRNIIATYHSSDCCEDVYLDYSEAQSESVIKRINDLKEITSISINVTPKEGITVFLYNDNSQFMWDPVRVWVFLPSRNDNNGYYSSDLDIIIKMNNRRYIMNINDAVEEPNS